MKQNRKITRIENSVEPRKIFQLIVKICLLSTNEASESCAEAFLKCSSMNSFMTANSMNSYELY